MITLNDARRIIAAAEKKATEIGQPMNIAVAVDGAYIGSKGRSWVRSALAEAPANRIRQ